MTIQKYEAVWFCTVGKYSVQWTFTLDAHSVEDALAQAKTIQSHPSAVPRGFRLREQNPDGTLGEMLTKRGLEHQPQEKV